MLYGLILTWSIMLLALVTVNLTAGRGELLLYPLNLIGGALIFSILISGLSASLGVLVSLRAGSVRQAQQLMSAGMLFLFVPFMLLQFLPRTFLASVVNMLQNADPVRVALMAALVLLMIDLVLILIGMRLFQRSRLILD